MLMQCKWSVWRTKVGAALRAALVASTLDGTIGPVDLRAVCLVRAIGACGCGCQRAGELNSKRARVCVCVCERNQWKTRFL